jgi:endonuclease/exonuclease/phosphatase family metal-dependent hydrolase
MNPVSALLGMMLMMLPPSGPALANPANGTNGLTGTLCVMTYNLRYASSQPPNAWPQRRPLVRDLVRQISPDVIGTQEGLFGQLQDVAADLPEYEWTGVGRDGGTKGEFMAVFYRRDRLEPLSTNHFWLSDTPEVVASSTWGNTCKRMVTWLKFRDRRTTREFYFINTHFDHEVQKAREKSAELVRQRVSGFDTNLPVLLVGDFNAEAAANPAYEILTHDRFFVDAWAVAPVRQGEGLSTFNSFKAVDRRGVRIDWILMRGEVTADQMEINPFARDGQFPSDHFPVTAWLRLGAVTDSHAAPSPAGSR